MSDTEDNNAPVVTEASAPPPADNSDLPSYDEALLIKVKGKVKRPAKPDDSERNIAITKLQAEITKNSDRIKQIKEILDNRRNASRAVPPAQQEIRKRLEGFRNEFQTVLRQKQHIREELNAAIEQRQALRDEIRATREKMPRGVNADSVESKIQEIEFKLSHESVSESEEKKLQQLLSQLNAAKPLARSYALADAKLKEVEEQRAAVSKRLSECDAVLNGIKAKEEVDRTALEAERAKDQGGDTLDYGALTVEKQECWQMICAYRDKITEIRKNFDDQYKEYIKLDKNYNAWRRHEQRKQYLERQKAREERDADRQANDEAATGEHPKAEAYESEIFTLDQLLTYLRKLVGTAAEAAKAEEKKEVEIPSGMKLFKRKDDEDFMVVKKPVKGGAKGGAVAAPAKGAAAASSSSAAAEPAKKKLTHTIELLQTFMTFSIEVPTSTADLPAAIEKAEAKKAHYLELRKKKAEAPAKKAAAKEAAAKEDEPEAEEEEAAAPASNGDAKEPEQASTSAPADAAEPAKEAPAAEEAAEESKASKKKKKKAAGDASAAANGDVGVTLGVDEVTQKVSLTLNLA